MIFKLCLIFIVCICGIDCHRQQSLSQTLTKCGSSANDINNFLKSGQIAAEKKKSMECVLQEANAVQHTSNYEQQPSKLRVKEKMHQPLRIFESLALIPQVILNQCRPFINFSGPIQLFGGFIRCLIQLVNSVISGIGMRNPPPPQWPTITQQPIESEPDAEEFSKAEYLRRRI